MPSKTQSNTEGGGASNTRLLPPLEQGLVYARVLVPGNYLIGSSSFTKVEGKGDGLAIGDIIIVEETTATAMTWGHLIEILPPPQPA